MFGHRRISRAAVAAAAALAALAVGGCGGREQEPEAGTSITVQASDGVEVAGGEYYFDPSTVVAEGSGALEITFVNEGSLAHNLAVFRDDEEVATTQTFTGGERETITADLEPGDYRMVCTVADHAELGMVGDIEVTGR